MSSRSSSVSSSATSSRGTSPARTCQGQSKQCSTCLYIDEILKNKTYFNLALFVFVVLCCITLSFNLPADYQKILSFKAVEEFSTSMERACNFLFLLNVAYLVAAVIVRKRAGL